MWPISSRIGDTFLEDGEKGCLLREG